METIRSALVTLLLISLHFVVIPAVGARAQGALDEPLPLETRTWIAAKMFAEVQTHFSHWEGVPDLDFEEAFREYLEEAIAAPDRRAFSLASMAFLARLANGHTGFFDQELRRMRGGALGFSLTETTEGWAVERSRLAGLEPGQRVTALDGRPPDEVIDELARYISASSEREAHRKVWSQGAPLWPLRFTVETADGTVHDIRRGSQELEPVAPARMDLRILDDGIAYARIPSFSTPEFEDATLAFLEEHADAPALVIDVRRNGGGTSPERLVRALMDRPYQGFAQSTHWDVGLFSAYQRVTEIVGPGDLDEYTRGFIDAFADFEQARIVLPSRTVPPEEPIYRGPIVVLIDGACASACETFVQPLASSGRATLIGAPTNGSTGQPFLWDFGDGLSFRVSARRVSMPDGSRFEGVGIEPDVHLRPSADDLREGRDPLMERALEVARGR